MKTTRSQISNVDVIAPKRSNFSCFVVPHRPDRTAGFQPALSIRTVFRRVSSSGRLLFGGAMCLLVAIKVFGTEAPTPVQLGKTPPPFPAPVVGTNDAGGLILSSAFPANPPPPVVYVTNTVYIIPSNTVIRIQVRDQLDSGDWFEPVVFKSRTDYKFFRVLFETEAEQ